MKSKNPLLTQLSVMCLYFEKNHWKANSIDHSKRQKDYSDMQLRSNHFESILYLISLGDEFQIIKEIKSGKSQFGAWKIGGYQLNAFRTANYADYLNEMIPMITEENISNLVNNITGTAVEAYIRSHILKGKFGATEILGVMNYEIEANKKPAPAPATAPTVQQPAPMNITIQTESTYAEKPQHTAQHGQSPYILMPGMMSTQNKDTIVDAKEKLRFTTPYETSSPVIK